MSGNIRPLKTQLRCSADTDNTRRHTHTYSTVVLSIPPRSEHFLQSSCADFEINNLVLVCFFCFNHLFQTNNQNLKCIKIMMLHHPNCLQVIADRFFFLLQPLDALYVTQLHCKTWIRRGFFFFRIDCFKTTLRFSLPAGVHFVLAVAAATTKTKPQTDVKRNNFDETVLLRGMTAVALSANVPGEYRATKSVGS